MVDFESLKDGQCKSKCKSDLIKSTDGLHRFRAGMEHGMDVSFGLRQWATPSIRRATVAKRELVTLRAEFSGPRHANWRDAFFCNSRALLGRNAEGAEVIYGST